MASRHSGQRGYVLLSIMLLMTVMLIMLTIEAPRIAQQIRREREEELVHRGREYSNAIRKFYRRFGQYPASLDQLDNTNGIRFLRKRYKDPMTGKDDWKLVHVGEAQVNLGSVNGTAPGSTLQSTMPGANTGSTLTTTTLGQPLGGTSGQLGGGPIIGVASTAKGTSIKLINGKDQYSDWQFVYDPRLDAQGANQGVAVGQGSNGTLVNGGGIGNSAPTTAPTTPPKQ